MAVSLTRFSWLFGGKDREPVSNGSSSFSASSDWGLGVREVDNVKFPSVKGARTASSSTRNVKRKWRNREERRIDKEYDLVLVPPDGVYLSGSESDESDWSIGWLEPHAPDFQSDDDHGADNSFAVLVPCYSRDFGELELGQNTQFSTAVKNLPIECADGKKYVEQWLSSLQYC